MKAFVVCSNLIVFFLFKIKLKQGKKNYGQIKRKKLTDAYCRDLPRLDKHYFKPGDYPGLAIMGVIHQELRLGIFNTRLKVKKYQEKKFGNYPACRCC